MYHELSYKKSSFAFLPWPALQAKLGKVVEGGLFSYCKLALAAILQVKEVYTALFVTHLPEPLFIECTLHHS
ncbi:MAG: hypothetical protein AB8V79_00100 [Candidatus Midichloria sp.]